jgi:hypothetical protein
VEIMKGIVFWGVEPCSLVEVDRRFTSDYCLHHQGDHPDETGLHGATFQKDVIFIIIACVQCISIKFISVEIRRK